jgi:hypothetical protein
MAIMDLVPVAHPALNERGSPSPITLSITSRGHVSDPFA